MSTILQLTDLKSVQGSCIREYQNNPLIFELPNLKSGLKGK